MKKEDTLYDQYEDTQYDDNKKCQSAMNVDATANDIVEAECAPRKMKGEWKIITVGAATGVMFGGVASAFTNGAIHDKAEDPEPIPKPDPEPEPQPEPEPDPEPQPQPKPQPGPKLQEVVVDDSVRVACCVDDRMTFSQAFAAARAEVGGGGIFEWHGNVYNTFYAEEWNNLSPEQREEFTNQLAWAASQENQQENQNTHEDQNTHQEAGGEPEVEILGVVHDATNNMNCGYLEVDGHEAYVVDVDNDMTFDMLTLDANDDGDLQENEVHDISNQYLTVDHLGGFTNANGTDVSDPEPDVDYIE